jgi:DNA modification methylase
MLQQLRAVDSMSTLRRRIIDLKQQLGNPDSQLRARIARDNLVEFPHDYLADEIDQIAASQTLERASYYITRLMKSITQVRVNPINDINLNRWKEYEDIYTDSLWRVDRRDSSGAHTAGYWGNFIPQIPYQMMRRYTKKGDWVLDVFAGSGTTLIEAQRLGRHCIGIELQNDVAEQGRRLIASEPNEHGVVSEIITGDSTAIDYHSILQRHGQQSVQLVIMHPPYFDIITFSDDPRDLSNARSVDAFLEMMGRAIDNAVPLLDAGRYLILVIGDKYAKGEWIPLGFLTMNEVLKRDFSLKSIIVKNFEETTGKRNQKELWKYRALVGGFYIFKHEYIFVFKKR